MFITRMIDEKRRYRRYRVRRDQLPMPYRTACEAVERYLMVAGGVAKGDVLMLMLDDLIDLFEQGAANGTPVPDIVGDDPVDFAEEFLRNYSQGQWVDSERQRLVRSIGRTTGEGASGSGERP